MSAHQLMLFCLKFAGMISINDGLLLKAYTWYHVTISIHFGISLLLFIILDPKPIMEKLQTVHYVIALVQIFCKFLSIVLNQQETLDILSNVESLSYQALKDQNNKDIIDRADRLSIKISKFFMYFYVGYYPLRVTTLLIKYLVFRRPPQLFLEGTWIPPFVLRNYIVSIFYQAFTCICTGFTNASYSCLIVYLTIQISAQIQILRRMLEEAKAIQPCIILHQKLMRVNRLLAGLMFVEIVLSSFYSCICGFLIIKGLTSGGKDAGNHVHVLVLVIMRSFLICYCGNSIMKQGEQLHSSAYFGNWLEKSQKHKKSLQFFMVLTTVQPFQYNYRQIISIDMAQFMKSVQTTYSYLTMLLSVADHK